MHVLGRHLLAGAASGLLGALLFASAHAVIIVPIWGRMTSGLLSGVLAGTGAGWLYGEVQRSRANASPIDSLWEAMAAGSRFGALLWLAVAPVSGVDAILRAAGVRESSELVAVGVAVAVATGGGFLLGDRLGGTRRARIAGVAAAMLLTVAMAGPVPVGRGGRALGILLAVLPAAALGGAVLGAGAFLLGARASRRSA
ncbi:MAG: hypothetical protein ACREON_01855 [Gemmatimonadaceae bacterium]